MVCEYNLLTDIHIHTQAYENYEAGMGRFRQCLRVAGSETETLLLGDIAHTRCAGNYRDRADILRNRAKAREVIGGKKVYSVPGNHDDEDFIAEINGQKNGFDPYFIKERGHRILMLNSSPTIEGIRYNHGGFDDYHIDWIEKQLAFARDENKTVYICLHNPPFQEFHPQPWRELEAFEKLLGTHQDAGGETRRNLLRPFA